MPELLIVLLVISLIGVLAFPRVTLWNTLAGFEQLQKQFETSLNEARQEAILQGMTVTFRYDHKAKTITTYGGNFGALSDVRNRSVDLSGFGLEKNYIAYGFSDGLFVSALTDTSSMTPLTDNVVEVVFQPDGSVKDAAGAAQNNALFFYHKKYSKDTAFAASILGSTGQVKIWGYSKKLRDYVEKR